MALMSGSNSGGKYPSHEEVESFFEKSKGVTTPYRLAKNWGLGGAQGTAIAKKYGKAKPDKLVAIRDQTTELVMPTHLEVNDEIKLKELVKEGMVFPAAKLTSGTTKSEFVGEEPLTDKEVTWSGRK